MPFDSGERRNRGAPAFTGQELGPHAKADEAGEGMPPGLPEDRIFANHEIKQTGRS
jgi:hypothetical protein